MQALTGMEISAMLSFTVKLSMALISILVNACIIVYTVVSV